MGLEQVKDEIIGVAKAEATRIAAAAQKEAQEIESKADQEVAEYQEQAAQKGQELQALMERKLLAQARFDAQRLVLNTKKEAVAAVMQGTTQKIASLGRAERKEFLHLLLSKAKKEISVDVVFVGKQDLTLLKEAKHVKEESISGGLIAQNKEGTISVNLSVEELLESTRQEMLVKVSEVLFHE